MTADYGKIIKQSGVYSTLGRANPYILDGSIKVMYDTILGRKFYLDKVTNSKVYISGNSGYSEEEEAIQALIRAREDELSNNQAHTRSALAEKYLVDLGYAEPKANLPAVQENTSKNWLVPAPKSDASLAIDKDLRERGLQILRIADGKTSKSIIIARQVRRIMGHNFVGNLPWEPALDWEVCKALRDVGLLERVDAVEYALRNGTVGKESTNKLDANGNTYTDVYFRITQDGQDAIDTLNKADPSYLVAQNHTLIGEAGMRVLEIIYGGQGQQRFSIPLTLFEAQGRLQKLMQLGLLKIQSTEIQVADRSYLCQFGLTTKGADAVKRATESGWRGFKLAAWETQREAKAAKYLVEMLTQELDEVVDYGEATVPVPQIASTRKGRGGFGMTAKRYGGRVGERTDFRWSGRKVAREIEMWKPEVKDESLDNFPQPLANNVGLGRGFSQTNTAASQVGNQVGTNTTLGVYTSGSVTAGNVILFPREFNSNPPPKPVRPKRRKTPQ